MGVGIWGSEFWIWSSMFKVVWGLGSIGFGYGVRIVGLPWVYDTVVGAGMKVCFTMSRVNS